MFTGCAVQVQPVISVYFIVMCKNKGEIEAAKGLSSTIRSNIGKIYVSTLCPLGSDEVGKMAYASQIANISGGIMFADGGIIETGSQDVQMQSFSSRGATGVSALNNGVSGGLVSAAKENIQSILGTYFSDGSSLTISPLGLKLIKLNKKLTDSSGADFDQDGLTDWNEVDRQSIADITKVNTGSINEITSESLPTIMDCLNHFDGKYYIEGAKAAVSKYAYASGSGNWNINVLPLLSDPADADSDSDGIPDILDETTFKLSENNDDIKNGWSKDDDVFVSLKTESVNTVSVRPGAVLKSLPIDGADLGALTGNTAEVLSVALTSKDSWIKVKNGFATGYIHGDYVSVNDSNEPLLRIMFGDTNIVDGVSYYKYWLSKGDITVAANNKYVDSKKPVIGSQKALSQSELGFLYAVTNSIGDEHGINTLSNEIRNSHNMPSSTNGMFEWLLAIGLHETTLGMADGTWKDISTGKGVGYFQITRISARDFHDNLYRSKITQNWLDQANRLDKIDLIYTEEKQSYYYSTIVMATGIVRRYTLDYDKKLTGNEKLRWIFQRYGDSTAVGVEGFDGNEFISIVQKLYEYEDRWS